VSFAALTDLNRSTFQDDYLPSPFAPDVLDANDPTDEERLAAVRLIESIESPTPTVLGDVWCLAIARRISFHPVQRFGMGIARARRLLAENGNPAPVFNVQDSYVMVGLGQMM
jgi:hypothetical protein